MLNVKTSRRMSRAALKTIAVPDALPSWADTADGGRRYWEPIQHGKLADTIVQRLRARSLEVTDESWSVTRKGLALIGSVDVEPGPGFDFKGFIETHGIKGLGSFAPEGVSLSLGVQHSNDGRWSVRFARGARVKVCSNGMIVTAFDEIVREKHSRDLSLADHVDAGIDGFLAGIETVGSFADAMRARELTDREGDGLLIDAGRAGVMPWRFMPLAAEEWRAPRFAEFRERTAWSLYNAFTFAVQAREPVGQMQTLDSLREFFQPVLAG